VRIRGAARVFRNLLVHPSEYTSEVKSLQSAPLNRQKLRQSEMPEHHIFNFGFVASPAFMGGEQNLFGMYLSSQPGNTRRPPYRNGAFFQ